MPDAGMADFQLDRQHKIILACEKWWPLIGPNGLPNRADCSGFVKSVAQELGIILTGDANHIYQTIQKAPWSPLGFGDQAAHLAAIAATNGKFVLGASQGPSNGNGHAVIIVDTNYSSPTRGHRKRAIAYWGKLHSVGAQYTKHSDSWRETERARVFYAARDLPF